MPPLFFPLYYQLLQAYNPSNYSHSPPVVINTEISSPLPQILGQNTEYSFLPPIGGEGKVVSLALVGDSMIDTLSEDICQNSLHKYFPGTKFNLLKYGYGSTTIESVIKRLTETTTYLDKENPALLSLSPDIIVIESFAYNNFGNSQKGIEKHQKLLQEITDLIKEKSPSSKIVLASTIAPNSISFASGLKNMHFSAFEKIEKTNTIKLYLQNLINFAKKNNLPLADAFSVSLFGENGSSDYIDSVDNLHPSNLGTELFCDILAKSLKDNSLTN
ncbi:MAG TPA: SGNH/GDSL hydrolase family protein [Candidatus Woesebacteria bacterium]|nr:SGNH/GDSL hydrolase family protein [Candidatus Woesebacteria bacterium]